MCSRHTGVIERSAAGLSQLCEPLLSSSQLELTSLPHSWINIFIQGVSPQGPITYLRRSAGLPHAVLAILHAERSSGKAHMFTTCMAELLNRASTDATSVSEGVSEGASDESSFKASTSDEWLARVHALNLCRLIFLDKSFGLRVMPYVSRGFLAAFSALSSAEWAVRNSGMLLFAALLERALRQRRTRDAHASHGTDANGIGIRDFFARAPELQPFLLSALRDIICSSSPHPQHPHPQ
eukprot:CAMPEP_0174707842 /NCGR_PEP_ID=MMETSP1094-20130205/10252_1 /TAXON_ID=156173 /ORGANISM="Chrysochromulina brevifilum, Strain UTEX LB 985" /LENGTH=238 /DNA_ID=CAMNT_0015906295 /DNA_START=39 /DNA_END=752 /DNA_ORIENTATION=+